ncbi:MAG TPA: nuclear transport factor 2 family protein [Thermoanaerobaculia bacterium]|jgi:ketosteroid isomerase-like protein|nr:nuclear transport factor 2 family protein [Thermoanaerobaculia bacterium]
MTHARRLLALALLLSPGFVLAQASDADAVRAVVQSAYVEGVHANPDADRMRAGFSPDFRMFVLRDGKMTAVTLEEWIGRMEANRKLNPNAPKPAVRAEFPIVDVTANEAVVKVELYRDGKHAFTDLLLLYRFPDGWKIVSKIFQSYS